MATKSTKPVPTAAQLSEWTAKYGHAPKRSEIAWEMEQEAARAARKPDGLTFFERIGVAAPVHGAETPSTPEQMAFAVASSAAQTEQAAAYRAARYTESESPADAARIERAADARHEDC